MCTYRRSSKFKCYSLLFYTTWNRTPDIQNLSKLHYNLFVNSMVFFAVSGSFSVLCVLFVFVLFCFVLVFFHSVSCLQYFPRISGLLFLDFIPCLHYRGGSLHARHRGVIYTQRKKLSTPMFFSNDKWYDKYHEITDQIISRTQWWPVRTLHWLQETTKKSRKC